MRDGRLLRGVSLMPVPMSYEPVDGPLELHCDGCGSHHIVEQETLEAFVSRSRFRCDCCRRRVPMRHLETIILYADATLGGKCAECLLCPGYTDDLYEV